MDLVLNNLQWLICYKTKPTIAVRVIFIDMFENDLYGI